MAATVSLNFYPLRDPSWPSTVAALRTALDAPHNPLLLPDYFLEVVLPKLGGAVAGIKRGEEVLGYGFFLPRGVEEGRRVYTLRLHPLPGATLPAHEELATLAQEHLPASRVVVYDPAAAHTFCPDHQHFGPVDIGRPSAEEARQIPGLQQAIWNNPPDMLYPADIHSQEFRPGTSLVARVNGELAAFLLGFYKFEGPPLPDGWAQFMRTDLRLESQVMGVLPEHRGRRIGFLLKRRQAQLAQAEDIHLINWTVDPLQFPNAVLNFMRLRAVALDFHPNLYRFRNELNRVAPSRFSITWLVRSKRVQRALVEETVASPVDLNWYKEIVRVNHGHQHLLLGVDAPQIAVEIPANWTELQRTDQREAVAWREATDELFQCYVGWQPGRYVVTAAGVDGPRRFLIAERVSPELLARLAR